MWDLCDVLAVPTYPRPVTLAEIAARYPNLTITLVDDTTTYTEQSYETAMHTLYEGAGLAIVDRNMIVEELADGSLAQFSDIEVTGPFGYWLDVAQEHAGLEYVQAFAAWMREEVLKTG